MFQINQVAELRQQVELKEAAHEGMLLVCLLSQELLSRHIFS